MIPSPSTNRLGWLTPPSNSCGETSRQRDPNGAVSTFGTGKFKLTDHIGLKANTQVSSKMDFVI